MTSTGSAPDAISPKTARISQPFVTAATTALAVCVVLATGLWGSTNPFGLMNLEPAGRQAVYQTLATLSGTLLGLTVTTVGLLLANLGKPMTAFKGGLPNATAKAVVKTQFQLIRALAILCVACLALLATATTGPWSQAVLAGLFTLAAIRFSRMVYWLSKFTNERAEYRGVG